MKEINIKDIAEIIGSYGMPGPAEPGGDIKEIEEEHLLRLVESGEFKQFLEESKSFSDNREFISKAVKINGLSLEAASDKLRDDKDLVMQAIENSSYGYALEYASPKLRADKEVIETAALNDIDSIRFADKSLLADEVFAKELIQIEPGALKYLQENLKDNSELVLLAISEKPETFKYAGEKVRQQVIDLIKANQLNGSMSEHASSGSDNAHQEVEQSNGEAWLNKNPIDVIKQMVESVDESGEDQINHAFARELFYWIRQLHVRLKTRPEANLELPAKVFNYIHHNTELSLILDRYQGKGFKERMNSFLQEVDETMVYDPDWLDKPGFWNIVKG